MITRPEVPVPQVPGELTQFRPSYRMLCYVLSLKAYQANTELAGFDRPESVSRLNAEVYSWADIDP